MAVKQMNEDEFSGLSTDPKPTTNANVPLKDGVKFLELDTSNWFIYSSSNICPTTNNNWWPL
jgi:hypothetical protein